MGLSQSPGTEPTLRTQEDQLDIALYKRQRLSCRAVARKIGCSPRTAKKYMDEPERIGQPRKPVDRPSLVDPYRAKIAVYLEEDPGCLASVVHGKLRADGFTGGYGIVKCAVRPIRAQEQAKAYVRFETEPGAQAQVDFAEFQVELADGSVKKYFLFAMVLGYSRMLFARLVERCDMISFLESHVAAFAAFGGGPSEILYDRMRNVFVRQLAGKGEFTQSVVDLATHYGFRPRVAPAYAPWVKGKIERPLAFVREGFWRGYRFIDLDTANRDLAEWLKAKAERVHGTTHERVDVRFARELPHLQPLPPQPCDVSERLYRDVRKDCTIAVHGNQYVVPHTLVSHQVVVRVRHGRIRVFDGAELVVTYDMPEGKGHLVQDPRFYEALRADRELQARKFGDGRKHKGRATISPSKPAYPIDVELRCLDDYAFLGGEVGYA